jgi:hypothetical protein
MAKARLLLFRNFQPPEVDNQLGREIPLFLRISDLIRRYGVKVDTPTELDGQEASVVHSKGREKSVCTNFLALPLLQEIRSAAYGILIGCTSRFCASSARSAREWFQFQVGGQENLPSPLCLDLISF